MFAVFLILLAAACFICVAAPRYSLMAMLVIGFSQDPFRKLVAGEPIIFIVMVGVVFGVMFLKTLNVVGLSRSAQPFIAWSDDVRKPLVFFLMVLVLQFFHSFLRWGNPIVSLIGMISYLSPFLAIIVGYYAIDRMADIRRFMKIYVLIGLLLAITVAMSFSGIEFSIFREVGSGLKIYDQGTVLRSYSGFMRTGEIAAWHLATSACFLIILYVTSSRKPPVLMVAALVILFMLAITFTGRRKMLMLVTLFSFSYLLGYLYYRKTLAIAYFLSGVSGLFLVWVAVQTLFPEGYSSDVQNYLARSSSVYSDASGRFLKLGLKPVSWALERVGLLGGGLGIASQGVQFFQNTNIAGGSGEGGLGKVMVELGLPGLLATAWLMLAFARYINKALALSAQHFVSPYVMPLILGFSVLLGVNVLTFTVATQVYGDIFILLMLGMMSGFVFALPKLVVNSMSSSASLSQTRTAVQAY